jgi:hypothetical protein
MNRRTFLTGCGGAAALAALGGCRARGETLYNGIVLPHSWPPNRAVSMEPETPPYLVEPPGVIPIDVGRQLFVDDFLIDSTTLRRTFHKPVYHAANPVLQPDRRWEVLDPTTNSEAVSPTAMVYSDGVFWDPELRLFRMWYMGGYTGVTCCATSADGVSWDKPDLGIVAGTNIVVDEPRDSSTVWRDTADPDPARRFKLAKFCCNQGTPLRLFASADGLRWRPVGESGPTGDRTTVFYNPFRKRWIYSLRSNLRLQSGRYRRYWEASRFEDAKWSEGQPVQWVSVDRLDPRRDGMLEQPELYALDCVAYESVLLGLFTIWRGDPHDRPKLNEIFVGFSRDGFHWARPDRTPFLPLSDRQGGWNWGNLQSAGGCCLVAGDRLLFYVSGRAGVPGTMLSGRCTTGLATLRRDGFCAMSAGAATATLTTRPLRFSGSSLFVNAAAADGELRVEVLDRRGRAVDGFTADACIPVSSDTTRAAVRWRDRADLGRVRGEPVRLRFHLRRASLFSFWVSADISGRSRGYVAAGGPEFEGAIDG